jgi:hypothetical protein
MRRRSIITVGRDQAVGEASLRDVETLWACEARSQRFGLTLVAAFDEWFAAKSALNGGSVIEAARFYSAHHTGQPDKSFAVVADEFYSAMAAAGASFVYCRSLRHYLSRMRQRTCVGISVRPVDEEITHGSKWPKLWSLCVARRQSRTVIALNQHRLLGEDTRRRTVR